MTHHARSAPGRWAAALAWAVLGAVFWLGSAGGAAAQATQEVRAACSAQFKRCVARCDCPAGDLGCLIRCRGYARCIRGQQLCLRNGGPAAGGAVEKRRAPAPIEPSIAEPPVGAAPPAAAPAPAPNRARTTTRSARTHTRRLTGRIFFLQRFAPEPRAKFYGYLVIGRDVTAARKIAVARGIGCRLDVAPTLEEAEKIKDLGLVSIPTTKPATGGSTNPAELLGAYDTVRADRWMRAAAEASGEEFDPATAVLFIASDAKRAEQLDARRLPDLSQNGIVIADASLLSPRYLERWTHEVVQGVKSGRIASKGDMHSLMAWHSWLTNLGAPLAAVMKIAPAEAAAPPASCLR